MFEIGIRAIQAVFALGLLALGVSGVWALMPSARAAAPTAAVSSTEPPRQPGMPRYQIIPTRNLFRASDGSDDAAEESAMPADLAESRFQIELQGTVVTDAKDAEGRSLSVASLRDTDSFFKRVAIGDELAGGKATVAGIEARRIVIEVAGRLEAVSLPEDKKDGAAGSSPSSTAPDLTPGGIASVTQRLRAQMSGQPSDDGFSITRVTPGSDIEQAGFRAGDVALAINGTPIAGGAFSPDLIPSMLQSEPVITVRGPDGGQREIVLPRDLLMKLIRQ